MSRRDYQEKVIDDWLYARKVGHSVNVSYPGQDRLTADFVVGDVWIEFFGLSGEHKRYDELKKEKLDLVEQWGLRLVEIYPCHLFPENRLLDLLEFLMHN